MSADQSLTGKGKIRRLRRGGPKRRGSTPSGGALTDPWRAILAVVDMQNFGTSIDVHGLMLQGCSLEALGALEAGSRWRFRHSDDEHPVLTIGLVGRPDPERLSLKSAVFVSALGHVDLPVQALEDVEQDDEGPSPEDSFKTAFRKLRGSIDPDLKLEI